MSAWVEISPRPTARCMSSRFTTAHGSIISPLTDSGFYEKKEPLPASTRSLRSPSSIDCGFNSASRSLRKVSVSGKRSSSSTGNGRLCRCAEAGVHASIKRKTRQPSSDCRSRSQDRGLSGTPTTSCARPFLDYIFCFSNKLSSSSIRLTSMRSNKSSNF